MSPLDHDHRQLPTVLRTLAAGLTDPEAARQVTQDRPARGGRSAAVLVLIATPASGPEIVLVERAATLRHHPGQMALPGGGVDDTDPSPVEAALREGVEEIGLNPSGVTVLGQFPAAHVAVSGYDVVAVVGWWHQPAEVSVVDSGEVAQVLRVRIADLVAAEARVTVRHRSGYQGPAFWVADPTDPEVPMMVWGLTAHFLDGVLDLAGWSHGWDDTAVAEIPARYLQDGSKVDHGGTDAH